MADDERPDLLIACETALGVLCDEYAFEKPRFERIGREHYVRFDKGPRTVSVAMEPGATPIIELFFPCAEEGAPEVPWTRRGDTPYSRRIPELRIDRIRPRNLDDLVTYLRRAARELCRLEHEFLTRC